MTYREKWGKYRTRTKIEREISLKRLLQKLSDIIEVYLEAHDVVTKIGLEITTFTDKYNT
jgi:hypothetical protein